MMRPEVIAKATNYVAYANGNKASQPLIDPEILADKRIYPDEETTKKLYVKLPYDPRANRVVTRIWTKGRDRTMTMTGGSVGTARFQFNPSSIVAP